MPPQRQRSNHNQTNRFAQRLQVLPRVRPGLRREAVSLRVAQRIDRMAIEQFGIPRLLLMDHAGLAVADVARTFLTASPSRPRKVVALCGSGYNGGDALSAAWHLHHAGYPVAALHLDAPFRDEPGQFAAILRALRVPLINTSTLTDAQLLARLRGCLAIDGLLGIGLRGNVRPDARRLIASANAHADAAIAADVPSGLDADTGRIHGDAIRAAVTVTFGRPKRGLFLREGPAVTGRLLTADIGLPSATAPR